MVSVLGTPLPGITVDTLKSETINGLGGGSSYDQYTVTSIGNAVASDSFSSNDSETVTNTGHANISQILTSTDAAGTTKNVNVSSKTNFGLTGFGTASDSDSGSYTLTEVNGLPASFVENDTAIQSSDFTPWSQLTTNAHIVVVSSDPTMGTHAFCKRGGSRW